VSNEEIGIDKTWEIIMAPIPYPRDENQTAVREFIEEFVKPPEMLD
jgi:hypothetical protein